jgi:DNA repair exonuclease SbcCD nuclease subunit
LDLFVDLGQLIMSKFKLGLLADLHLDTFPNISIPREDMLTDRADELSNLIKQAFTEMLNEDVTHCVILGDIFHRRNVRQDAINNLVRETVKYGTELGLKIVLLVGNHDQAAISGEVHALESFKEFCTVIDKPQIVSLGGFDCYFLPYEEYKGSIKSLELLLKQGKNSNRILLGHIGIENAFLSGFDHISREPVTIEELQMDKFISCYFGHYHLPQKIGKNGYYVGSLCQHSLVDRIADRGWMLVEMELVNGQWKANSELVKLDSPLFIEVDASEYNPDNYEGKNYIKVVNAKRKDLKKLESDENVFATTGERIEQVVDEKKVIQAELSWDEMIDKYVNITSSNRREHKRLKNLGKELMDAS